jgi:hypothetical protein
VRFEGCARGFGEAVPEKMLILRSRRGWHQALLLDAQV